MLEATDPPGRSPMRSFLSALVGYVVFGGAVYWGVGWATAAHGAPEWVVDYTNVWLGVGFVLLVVAGILQMKGGRPVDSTSAPSGGDPNLATGTGSLDFRSTRPSLATRLLTIRNTLIVAILGLLAILALAGASMWITHWIEEEESGSQDAAVVAFASPTDPASEAVRIQIPR